MDIVIAGHIGDKGARELLEKHGERIEKYFAPRRVISIRKCLAGDAEKPLEDEGKLAELTGAGYIYLVYGEGIYSALWHFAEELKAGFEIDFRALPFHQETIELCECLGENPYEISSEGVAIIATADGANIRNRLREKGVDAHIVGCTTDGADRIFYKDGTVSYLNKPR